MGATVVAIWFVDEQRVSVAHVGDSRIYRLRGAEFVQLTQDHSFVAEQVRRGMMAEVLQSGRWRRKIAPETKSEGCRPHPVARRPIRLAHHIRPPLQTVVCSSNSHFDFPTDG